MRASKYVRGIFLHRLRVETAFGSCTDFCIADSAGQTLITPKLATKVLRPPVEVHTEDIIGLGLKSFDVKMFKARVSIELAPDVWRSADEVTVGIIPGLSVEDNSHQSGLPMFLGYDAMQALKVAPNLISKEFIDLEQPTKTAPNDPTASGAGFETAEKKLALFALNVKDIAKAIERYKKSHPNTDKKDG